MYIYIYIFQETYSLANQFYVETNTKIAIKMNIKDYLINYKH